MHVEAKARYLAAFHNLEELQQALDVALQRKLPVKILGGGSNLLFVDDFDGLILKNEILGREVVFEDEDEVHLKIGAGENWHDLVMHCVDQGWGGIENLALIPGTVGAAPVQNIGAYGVELANVFEELTAWLTEEKKEVTMTAEDCAFGYRESVFKHSLKDRAVILTVTLRLQKKAMPHYSYKALSDELGAKGIDTPTIKQVTESVIAVRQSKLPDPSEVGNNGSFFKNPVVPVSAYKELQKRYPSIPGYVISDEEVKVPAGWLIDQAGWKGFRDGDAGVYPKQALILVNYGDASGAQMLALAQRIQQDVWDKYKINITPEVNIIS